MVFLKTRGKTCDYEYFSVNTFPSNHDWWKKFKKEFYNPSKSRNIFIEIKDTKYEFFIDRIWYNNYRDLSGPDRPIGCVFLGSGNCNDEDAKFLFNLVCYLLSSKNYSFIDENKLLDADGSITSEYIQTLDSENGIRHKGGTEEEIRCRINNLAKYLEEFANKKFGFTEYENEGESELEKDSKSFVFVKKAEHEYANNFLRTLKKDLDRKNAHSFFVFTNLPVFKKEFKEFLNTNFGEGICGMIMTSCKESEEFEIQTSTPQGKKRVLLAIIGYAKQFFYKILNFSDNKEGSNHDRFQRFIGTTAGNNKFEVR